MAGPDRSPGGLTRPPVADTQVLGRRPLRLTLLAGAGILGAAGLYGGLVRLALPLPLGSQVAGLHGPIMAAGVFGTIISLERAVAMGVGWAYLAPVLSLLGAVALVGGLPVVVGSLLLALSASVLLAASVRIVFLQPALFTLVLAIGALAAVLGNLAWAATQSGPDAAAWWVAFLVLTIAGERLELSRVLRPGRMAGYGLGAILVCVLAGAALGIGSNTGQMLFGSGLIVLTLWLLRYDVATRTVRLDGRPRFFAFAMLAGYLWLPVSGMILLLGIEAPLAYDALLHSILIGFVISMVFGHALIILPAVVGARLAYHPALYVPLATLHLSVLLRVTGSLFEHEVLRQSSGLVTVLALLGFALTNMLVSGIRRRRS